MINAIIFDFDGLLADTEPIYFEVFKELLSRYDIPYDLPTYLTNNSGKKIKTNMESFIEQYHLPLTIDELVTKEREIENDFFSKHINLKPGALELLNYLKEHSYKSALATSSFRFKATQILKDNNIYDMFDAYVFAEDVTKGKPDPQVFLTACERLQEDSSNCLVLEDSENGVLAAYNAGIKVICIPDLKQPNQQTKEYCYSINTCLTEIIPMLEKKEI